MGQRLNVEIKNTDKVLANAYYQWSGYTSSSLILTKQIIGYLSSMKVIDADPVLVAIRLLEYTKAGLTEKELLVAQERFPNLQFAPCLDRNRGLIAISEKGIEETEKWEEARMTICLDTQTVNCGGVIWMRDNEENEEEENTDHIFAFIMPSDINNMSFERFSDFSDKILDLIRENVYEVYDKELDTIYTFIE